MFAKRLFLYFIGFFFGCVLVYFMFFKGKDRGFFPSAIVIDTLKSRELLIEEKAGCRLACYRISEDNLKDLMEDGDVKFSESSPREEPKKYVVEIESPEGDEVKLLFELTGSNAKIISVTPPPGKPGCTCD